jgi:hypothetical protein
LSGELRSGSHKKRCSDETVSRACSQFVVKKQEYCILNP